MRNQKITLDVVIPIFNEEEVISKTISRCREVFSPRQLHENGVLSVRFLFVDDGSRDKTVTILFDEIKKGFPAQVIRLSRNFGQQNAISAGLSLCNADLVGVMDADLQDPPEVLLKMIPTWREGNDVVYGVRKNRKESFIKLFGYWGFYRLLSFLSDKKVPLDSGDFSLMDRRVVSEMNALPEVLRFPRCLRSWVGFQQKGFEYDRPARALGDTKYSLRSLYQLATDGITSVTIKPLKLIQLTTFCTGLFLGVGLVATLMNFVTIEHRWLYLLISFYATITNLSLYVLAAYIGRTYLESKGRPAFLIAEILGKTVHNTDRVAA